MRSPLSRRAGLALRKLRVAKGWTLLTLSKRVGIPLSTLSKIELGQSVLSHEKWSLICRALDVEPKEDILRVGDEQGHAVASGRRSVTPYGAGLRMQAGPYDMEVVAAELLAKAFTPIVVQLSARTLEEHGPLRRAQGEMFVYALDGRVVLCSEDYEPLTLAAGDCVFFDAGRGHALLAGAEKARALLVVSSDDTFWSYEE